MRKTYQVLANTIAVLVVVHVDVGGARQVSGVVLCTPGRAGRGEAGVEEDGVEPVEVGDVEEQPRTDHQEPNGSGSGESATLRARAAVRRRRWCWRHRTS